MSNIKHRGIILIDEHDHLLATFLISVSNQFCQTIISTSFVVSNSPFLFFYLQTIRQIILQLLLLHVLTATHIEVEHWILRPVLFQLFDGKSLKEFFLAREIILEC